MKIEQSTAIKLRITEVESLDPITVFLEDYAAGKGKIVIECYGKSWSSYWGAMGDGNIAQFFCSCGEHYLISNLCGSISFEEPDYDAFLPLAREHILGRRRSNLIGSSLARALFDIEDWEEYAPEHSYDSYKCPAHESKEEFEYLDFGSITVPTKVPHEYAYMVRIVKAVQNALKESGLVEKEAA
ncbi:hypothetical protein O1B63_002280 [Vibrio cholerae]|nr:hypothetical protein [Vibrio cholerae]